MATKPVVHIFCGKMASGKSTLASQLAEKHKAVLISEDDWLATLYAGEITDIAEYLKYSEKLKVLITEHISQLLSLGMSIILDFPANTIEQRKWLLEIINKNQTSHLLHYIVASDELCKKQLKQRSKKMPKGSAFTTDSEFDYITKYFQPPGESEGFEMIRYER